MSKTAAAFVLLAFAVVGLAVGWTLGAPRSAPVVQSSFHTVAETPPDQTAAAAAAAAKPPGADTDPGWQDRNALRDRLSGGIQKVKADPCDPTGRAEFLDAFADHAFAMMDDERRMGGENIPAFWKTSDDTQIDNQIKDLDQRGYSTEDERGKATVTKRLGPDTVQALSLRRPRGAPMDSGPPVLRSSRCASRQGTR